jgi:hypothetical protein
MKSRFIGSVASDYFVTFGSVALTKKSLFEA